MNIAQALKQKNRLSKRLNELKEQMKSSNIVRKDDKTSKFVVPDLMTEYLTIVENLATLRGKIANASAPMASKIVMLSSKQALRNFLKELDVSGNPVSKIKDHYGSGVAETTEVDVQIDAVKRAEMVKSIETEVDQLQDELDTFNATTSI